MKAKTAEDVLRCIDIPNVGLRIARDFETLGIHTPQGLKGKNAFKLYTDLCEQTNMRHDPCVLDTFMAVVDFMGGAPAKPWWSYTPERKRRYPNV